MTGIERLEFLADVLADNEKYGAVAANLREIAAQITAELTDREGYESDVLAWVEEHGGLGRVSAAHERQKRHIDRVERWSAARAGRLKRHIATLEQALTRRNRRIRELEAQRDKSDLTHRAPVLASDGEPLEVGQTVYHTDTGREYQIHSINDDGKGAFVYNNSLGQDAVGLHLCPVSNLTHQRPVLDADGVPIKKGDEVYLADEAWVLSEVPSVKGEPLVVTHFKYNRERPVCAIDQFDIENGITVPWCLKPGWVTHTKPEPDSWSSVWADVSNGNESPEGMMRRCRALARRGE